MFSQAVLHVHAACSCKAAVPSVHLSKCSHFSNTALCCCSPAPVVTSSAPSISSWLIPSLAARPSHVNCQLYKGLCGWADMGSAADEKCQVWFQGHQHNMPLIMHVCGLVSLCVGKLYDRVFDTSLGSGEWQA